MSYSPHNLSPHVPYRTVRIHGSSIPSARSSGIADEHHERTTSGLDLASMANFDELREMAQKGGGAGSSSRATGAGTGIGRDRSLSLGSDSDDVTPLQKPPMMTNLRINDEYEVDHSKGELISTRCWSEDKQLPHEHPDQDQDDTSSEDGERDPSMTKYSPSEPRSLATSPTNIAKFDGTKTPNKKEGGRLLIVANRLPLSMKVAKKPAADGSGKEVNEITFSNSSGGLVSALGGCEMESRWIGWPGGEVKRSADRDTVRNKLDEQNCVPVFLTQKVCDPFYNGFCNNLLWPLFHYIPLPVESITTADEQFEAYKIANQSFADIVLRTYQDGDIVWIHDYHLMLLPRILRQQHPHIKIGFFFHTPFPAFEIYRVMPARQELLAGVLSADLIGFHTPDYQRHFQDSCVRILGATGEADTVTYDQFTSKLGAFPIGIDPKRFISTIESEAIKPIMEQYKKEFQGKKVFLGIDRLDYIKGIQHKIYALERLFEKHPNLAHEVVLVQIAVPSRTDVLEYQKLRASTHKLVGRVNGIYGGVGSAPIHYLDQSIPFDRMCALYRVADAMVITSIRDGMNLVAYEYITCQKDMAGTLILSEFAGATQSLKGGPIEVNPWSITSVSDAMYLSLTMPEAERRERNTRMFQHVTTHTSSAWARQFLTAVLQCTKTPLTWLKDLSTESTPQTNEEWETTTKSPAAVAPITTPKHL